MAWQHQAGDGSRIISDRRLDGTTWRRELRGGRGVQRDIWIGERSRVLQIEKSKWVSCGAPSRIDFGRCSGVSTGRRYGAYSQGFDEPMVQSGGSGVDGPVVQTGGSRVDVCQRYSRDDGTPELHTGVTCRRQAGN